MIEGFKTRNYRFKGTNPSNEQKRFWLAILIAIALSAAIIYLF